MAPANQVDMPYAPLWFQHTQNGLILASAILWSVAYAFYVRQAFRDRSYGMPILALWDSESTDVGMYAIESIHG